jgi:serine/threonine protein kinase
MLLLHGGCGVTLAGAYSKNFTYESITPFIDQFRYSSSLHSLLLRMLKWDPLERPSSQDLYAELLQTHEVK